MQKSVTNAGLCTKKSLELPLAKVEINAAIDIIKAIC